MLRDKADSEADHRRFIERVIRAETVWALEGDDGFAWCESNDYEDRDVIVFWSDRAYAERARKSEFPEYVPVEISLFDFLFILNVYCGQSARCILEEQPFPQSRLERTVDRNAVCESLTPYRLDIVRHLSGPDFGEIDFLGFLGNDKTGAKKQ